MGTQGTASGRTLDADDEALHTAVSARLGHGGWRIRSLEVASSDFADRAPVQVATVTLDDGTRLRIFVKHVLRQREHPDKRADRELRIYRDLFGDPALPVPALLNWSVESPGEARLFLEHVDGWPLKYHDLAHWRTAARELARLHAHFAERLAQLRDADFLLRLDAAHLLRWADRALRAVGRSHPPSASRLAEALQRYPSVIARVADAPPTLVHDDLAPKNVVVDPTGQPARIRFVDWELAGVGWGVMDLAHLKFGFCADEDAAIVAAYRGALRGTVLEAEDDAFHRLLAICECHKLLYRLTACERWGLPAETVAAWCGEVERLIAAPTERGQP